MSPPRARALALLAGLTACDATGTSDAEVQVDASTDTGPAPTLDGAATRDAAPRADGLPPPPDAEAPTADAAPPTADATAAPDPDASESLPDAAAPPADAAPVPPAPDASAEPPAVSRRILLVIVDDFGADWANAYTGEPPAAVFGHRPAPTPTIDGLCTQGVRFRNAWATPICSPTRATMLTGRYGFRTGIGWAIEGAGGLDAAEVTLPRALDASPALGFAHANIGKWHLGAPAGVARPQAPNAAGWGHFAGVLQGALPAYDAWTRTEDGVSAPETTYATTRNVDDAITWLGGLPPESPWFLWLAFNAPHTPLHVPPAALADVADLPGTAADLRMRPELYSAAMTQAVDTELARLYAWLAEQGQSDVTTIFLGDNGSGGPVVSPPLDRDHAKGTLYQGGLWVPLCVSGPLVAAPGRTEDALVSVTDVFATVLDLAGAAPAATAVDSVSMAPYLRAADAAPQRAWVYADIFGDGAAAAAGAAIRDDRFKLVRFEAGGEALYDLQADPWEQVELLAGGALEAAADEAYGRLSRELDALRAP